MSPDVSLDPIIDRLRSNLREACIPLAAADLERLLELDMLRNAAAFQELAADVPAHRLPDYAGEGVAPPATLVRTGRDGAASAAAPPREPVARPGDVGESIAAIARRIRAREVSPIELTERALERIAQRDPELNAFQLVTAELARSTARSAEKEIAAGRWLGPLHGVPVAIKDLLDLAGTPTSAGSRVLPDRPADTDAAAVERLRAAGAVIVGKTRLAEFAYSPGSNNAHFGPTRNPRGLSRDAGGSSSGSGAAVAAGLAFAALGTDTGGSIRIPASQCGIVGLKPTYGRASLHGAVPLSWSFDHVGPMTGTVTDAALLLEVLAGHDARDPRARAVPVPALAIAAVLDGGVRRLKVGVVGDDGTGEPHGTRETEDAWRSGLDALAHAGAELVPVDLPMLAPLRVINGAILAVEAAVYHAPLLRSSAAEYGEFARLRLLAAHAYAPGTFVVAQQARAACRRAFEQRLTNLDLLSTPTMPGPAPPLGVPGSTRYTGPFNVLGWPAISVPVGRTAEGLPLGLQLVGKPWDEATVLRAACVVEAGSER